MENTLSRRGILLELLKSEIIIIIHYVIFYYLNSPQNFFCDIFVRSSRLLGENTVLVRRAYLLQYYSNLYYIYTILSVFSPLYPH